MIALSFAAIGAVAVAGCTSDSSSSTDATLRVQNNSDFAITNIQVTSVGSSTWGGNLIAGDTLNPGESLRIDVACDTYDARLVDETNVECVVHDINLCFSSSDWIINNNTCSVFGAARAAREAAAKANGSAAPATPGSAAH